MQQRRKEVAVERMQNLPDLLNVIMLFKVVDFHNLLLSAIYIVTLIVEGT